MRNSYFLISLMIFFIGCKKPVTDADEEQTTCTNIQNATLHANSPVTVEETIKFGTQEVGGNRQYEWRGPNNFSSTSPEISIFDAQLKDEGWYYLHLFANNGSCEKIDSVFIDVKLKQGTPACSIANNTTTYNNLSADNYSSVVKNIDPTFSLKQLKASGGIYSNMTIYFHPYWRSAEPEDGIYTTINTPLFSQTDYNYNKVFITTTKNSMYWSSLENQTVYISHIGTKLQVRFCAFSLFDISSATYTTIASGNLIEQ